jgi:hypothetical protein
MFGTTPTQTYEMLRTAYGGKALSKAQIRLFTRFHDGRKDVVADARSERPKKTSNSELV